MSAPSRVAVVGAAGRGGTLACRAIEGSREFELVARVQRADDLESVLRTSRAAIALDCTRAGLGFEHAQRMLAVRVRPLIATSGVSPEESSRLDRQARELELGGLVVPNFSLGMLLLQRAALEAAKLFPECEIIEMHLERKQDAPSGTALETAHQLQGVRGARAAVPIHSVRLPGLYAHQLVIFGGPGESYTLRHDMAGPEAFAPGILAALGWVSRARGVARGLAVVLQEKT